MRKNIQEVWFAFLEWKPCERHDSISTDGAGIIYSYTTPLLVTSIGLVDGKGREDSYEVWRRECDGQQYFLNAEHFSKTTSAQQNALRYLLARNGFELMFCRAVSAA